MKVHFTHHYFLNPPHQITIDLVGMGGTGSQVLIGLARMNQALIGLGHPGLHVRAWDADEVTTANMGRQLFSPADVGINKAIVLITRVNRFFGYDWLAMPEVYRGNLTSNIIITCVDTAKARLTIGKKITNYKKNGEPTNEPYYWLDLGNLQKSGQCVLGTIQSSSLPSRGVQKAGTYTRTLKNVIQLFPQLKRIQEEMQGPSCSLAEALEKQDLFINSTLAQFGCNLLWKLIRDKELKYHGCYVNLESLSVNPLVIK